MTELINHPTLAIIGLGVNGRRYNSLESFGFDVYHGIEQIKSIEHDPLSAHHQQLFIENILRDAHLKIDEIGMITVQAPNQVDFSQLINDQSVKIHNNNCNDLTRAWVKAADWLITAEVNGVLVIEKNHQTQTLFAILLSTEAYAINAGIPTISTISGASFISQTNDSPPFQKLLQFSSENVNVTPGDIGLLLTSSPLPIAQEMLSPQVLNDPFQSASQQTCAISGGYGGLSSIIKALWCLNHRIIPGTKDWKTPADPDTWQDSPFYIPTQSRPWFTHGQQSGRAAIVINSAEQGPHQLFILRDRNNGPMTNNATLTQEPLLLFPIEGQTPQVLVDNILHFHDEIIATSNLKLLSARKMLVVHDSQFKDNFIACMIGASKEDIIREIKFALKGIPNAVEKKSDWRTPKGSYFTSEPLGEVGDISFVYPGAFSSYPGIAQDLIYLFPDVYNHLEKISQDIGSLIKERMLYPRQITGLTSADLADAENRLVADPLAMLVSGISVSTMFTLLLRKIFKVDPQSAFGYSLGEISMMFANGIWTHVDDANIAINASTLFHTRLAGPQNAIRESWNLPKQSLPVSVNTIWENHVLMAPPVEVTNALKDENRVFMTHLNTPNQVVIGGDPGGCRRVITALACNALQAPFNYALHCEPMQSEYDELKALLSWPVADFSQTRFYSAANYKTIPMAQETIAEYLATGLCHQLDFPRLVNQAYSDGARIFIELGAGGNCSRWIDETLKHKPHGAFSINRKGLNDQAAVLQLLAKLISHRVQLSLSPFLT